MCSDLGILIPQLPQIPGYPGQNIQHMIFIPILQITFSSLESLVPVTDILNTIPGVLVL